MRSAAIFLAAALSMATATGPVIEADGWTPVTSSQVARLPPDYLEQRQREDQERLRLLEEQRLQEEYLLEQLEEQLQFEQQQSQKAEREVEAVEEALKVKEETKTTPKAENEISVDKAPFIVYPENSIRQSSPPQAADKENVSVQTGASLPESARPFFNQPPPQRPPPPPGFQRVRRPPPRFNPKIRPPPPPGKRPPPPPQKALPRSDNVESLTEPRQFQQPQIQNRAQQPTPQIQSQPSQSVQVLQGPPPPGQRPPPPPPGQRPPPPPPGQRPPPLGRPYPPRGGRPKPRPRPRPGGGGSGFFGSIGSKVKCAAKNALSDIRLNDERFIEEQLQCVLDKGPCDEIGIQIKSE